MSLTLLSAALLAADKKSGGGKQKLSKGDKVEVEWAGQKVTAEFVEYAPTGWITVKFKSNGIMMNPTLPPDQVKVLAKRGKGSNAGGTAKLRTWTDKTGKHKVTAKFVELKDDEVTLETEEGKTITMALDKLSKEDQKAARDAAREADENPFKEKEDDDNPFEAGTAKADAADDDEISDGDWSGVETVSVGEPGNWSLSPDAAPELDKLAPKPVILSSTVKSKSGGQLGFFESVDSLLFDRGKGRAVIVIHDGTPGKDLEVKLQRVDLVQGKVQDTLPYPSSMKPVDIDPAGEQIVARSDLHFSRGHTAPAVSVWKIGDKGLKLVRGWSPQDPDNIHKVAPTFAQFVDADHVVTVSFPGKLVLWQVSKAKAVYRMDVSNNGLPALSVNRKYLAAPVNNGMYVFDALTGNTLGRLPGDPGVVTAMSFRPDGTQLAALSPQRLLIWDLVKGDLYRDIYFSQPIHGATIDWLARGYLMVGGENLIDLERRIVLWRYQHDAGRGGVARGYGEMGGQFWYALVSQDRKERGLFHSRLPHEDALRTALALKPDDLLAVAPGAQVSLNVAVQGDPGAQQTAYQALSGQLQQLGMRVVDGSKLVLQASTETGKSQQISYRSFGPGGRGVETANVTEQISKLKFVENGKVIWEAVSVSGAPHFLRMKQGESLQQALAPYQKPNVQFFASVKIPQYVARPSEAGAYGASNLTPQGIQSAPLTKPQQPPVAGR
jgi:hypothetical protein